VKIIYIMLLALCAGIIYLCLVMFLARLFSANDRAEESEERDSICHQHQDLPSNHVIE